MSTNNRNRVCSVDGNTIYYDTKTIDLKSTPTGKTAFEAVFLSDVISEISGQCFTVQENCKTLYPEITGSNWKEWITSIDQENRMSLAHTLEKSDIPILYNTPRLCDPGVSISKNWSLRNYIETRLYLFKFKYNFRTPLTRNVNNCYPSILFDFRPFQYKLTLPPTTGKNAPNDIFVTEYITVDNTSGAEGYTPHMSFSKNGTTFPSTNKPQSSTVIFDAMVKKLISTKLGNSNTSIINQKLNLGPNNRNVNQSFLNNFRKFIQEYDGAKFDPPEIVSKSNSIQTIKLTDDVIRVLFYDLYHDKVVSRNDFAKFKGQFKSQFYKSNNFDTSSFAGAKNTGKAYAAYGDIFFTTQPKKWKLDKKTKKPIKQIPAICKTLGDLSQFIYAAKYNTVVASGDKMGIATGLYINATMNKPVKCMMEDVITGFIIYSGLPNIKFIRKTTCASASNGGACRLNGATNKKNIQTRILNSVPSKKNIINTIINSKPKGIKRLLTLTGNSAKSQNITSVKETLNTLNKSYTYLNDTNLNKIIRILNVYNTKPNLRPLSTKIAEFKGKIQAQIETKKTQTGNKRKYNNNNNSNRNAKKLTTTTSANKLNTTTNANISARRVNKIRPFIMKMSHLTNNQKAYYINQARTNQTKKLSEIVKNARLRAYRRT
jgi:hypothetical protein